MYVSRWRCWSVHGITCMQQRQPARRKRAPTHLICGVTMQRLLKVGRPAMFMRPCGGQVCARAVGCGTKLR